MNEPPSSVLRAVRAMQAGMAASFAGIALNLVSDLSSPGAVRSALRHLEPHVTSAQIAVDQRVLIGESIAAGLIEAALWLWMAQSCRAGKAWARILSTVLFGIFTVGTAGRIARGRLGRHRDDLRTRRVGDRADRRRVPVAEAFERVFPRHKPSLLVRREIRTPLAPGD